MCDFSHKYFLLREHAKTFRLLTVLGDAVRPNAGSASLAKIVQRKTPSVSRPLDLAVLVLRSESH